MASTLRLGVLGAGSWGTALAVELARGGAPVRLWARSEERVAELRRGMSRRYLAGVAIPDAVQPTTELADMVDLDVLLIAIPSHSFRAVLRQYLELLGDVSRAARGGAFGGCSAVVSCTKGIENETLARMSEVVFEEAARANREIGFAVLSGPNFALELARGEPTASVVAADDHDLTEALRNRFSSGNLRVYSTQDVVGVELAGTAKNVVAIAAGTVAGLGFGSNTLAALMTRGLHEITRLGVAWGGRPRTFSGLAGLGDLILTCTGSLSRNRQTGLLLAEGKSLEVIDREIGMVAEGVRSSLALVELARRRSVEMPILEQMVAVMYHGRSPRLAVEELMQRDLKGEAEL